MAIIKRRPERAPKVSTSSNYHGSTPCINVSLLLKALLEKGASSTNLNNTRFTLPVVVRTKKEKLGINLPVDPTLGRGKRSASAVKSEASNSSNSRRVTSDTKKKGKATTSRKPTEKSSTANRSNSSSTSNMVRSNSSSSHRMNPSPLARLPSPLRSFSVGVGLEQEQEEELVGGGDETASSSGNGSNSLPNHLSDYEV